MSHKETRNIKATELRVADGTDGSKTLSGYAIVWNSPSVDLGGFNEICSPGMCNRSLRESPDIVLLRDHVSSQLLGRSKAGTLSLTSDTRGLAFTVRLPNTMIANDTVENIRLGNLDACSFGFNVPDGGDQWTTDGKGNITRTLIDVNLVEISVTSFAAYPATGVSLRSCPHDVRGLITRSNEDGCNCDCDACLDDDCERCSMDDCDDPECAENGCPAQNDDDEDRSKLLTLSERHKLHMRLELTKRQ